MTIMYPPQAAKIERFKTQVFAQTFSQFLYCVQQVFFSGNYHINIIMALTVTTLRESVHV